MDTCRQRTTFAPFLAPEQVGLFEPHRTTVETSDGVILETLEHARESFTPGAPWSAAQLAYFAGYAMWTYLTLPFSLLREGVECEEIAPWHEVGETWRAVQVRFPASFVTHSSRQVLYFDRDGLIRRHDYSLDVADDSAAAHYLHDYRVCDGLLFPARRRIHPRGPGGQADKDVIVMSADLTAFALEA